MQSHFSSFGPKMHLGNIRLPERKPRKECEVVSRMLCRRVPVLKLGSRGPGGDARSLRLWTQASASVRGGSDMPERRKSPQNRRHFLRFVLQKCQQSQGSGGSCLRSPELSSLLDSSRLFASQKCQQSQGSGGSCSRNPELSSLLALPLERGKERGEKRKDI